MPRRSCSGSATAQECCFLCGLGVAQTTEAFVSQHIFADSPAGRRKERNTLSMAVLPLGKESSSVLQHSPWGHGAGPATGSPVSPVWKEGPRLVTALTLINVPASKQPSPPGHC